MTKKAISYIRLSTKKQLSGVGQDRQQENIKQYCLDNDLEIIDSIADTGLSAYSGKNKSIGGWGNSLNK